MDEYKKIAAKLVSLKSVSSDKTLTPECRKTAEFLKELLTSYGFTAKIVEGYGNPVVLASFQVDPKLETCLIYGHYDVQPASREDGWESDPFEFVEKDGRFYGRGVMDDKCQFLVNIMVIGKLLKEKRLGYNIKFLFEGNEEEGSPYIEEFVRDHTKGLACDVILISDGEKILGKPTLELSNRGILNCMLTVTTATQDNHSGVYSTAVPNAIHELSAIVTSFFGKDNTIAIESFYDDVDPVTEKNPLPFDFDEYKKNTGSKVLFTEPGYDFYMQTGLRPSLTVTGMSGGYLGEGHKTSIPGSAQAKLSFRVVRNQRKEKLVKIIQRHLAKVIPDYVMWDLTIDEFAPPNRTDMQNPFIQKAKKILEEIFGEKVLYRFVGGTEPVVGFFQEYLGKPLVSVPYSDEDAHMHGKNENFKIKDIQTGMEFSERFFGN